MAPRHALAEEFLLALSQRSRVAAVDVVTSARVEGAGVAEIVERILRPAQIEVGHRWERDLWSVADEHAATVITEIALSAITLGQPSPTRGRWVAVCAGGEWHALAVRMAGESLVELGWGITFLGASVPPTQLERFLAEHRPDGVMVGVSMIGHTPAAAESVDAARRVGIPTVLGGAAVDAYPDCAAAIGAYAGTGDVTAVDDLLSGCTRSGPLPRPDDHDAARRCAALVRSRPQLVTELASRCRTGDWGLEANQSELLEASIGSLVDAAAAAVLLDEGAVLRRFGDWLSAALAARGPGNGLERLVFGALAETIDRHAAEASGIVQAAIGCRRG